MLLRLQSRMRHARERNRLNKESAKFHAAVMKVDPVSRTIRTKRTDNTRIRVGRLCKYANDFKIVTLRALAAYVR